MPSWTDIIPIDKLAIVDKYWKIVIICALIYLLTVEEADKRAIQNKYDDIQDLRIKEKDDDMRLWRELSIRTSSPVVHDTVYVDSPHAYRKK